MIPQSMQSEVLQKIHKGHMGVTKCRKRAQQTVWWKGINNDIQNTVESCQHCQIHKLAQRHEPMISTPLPSGPWLKIGADQLTFEGKEYMVIRTVNISGPRAALRWRRRKCGSFTGRVGYRFLCTTSATLWPPAKPLKSALVQARKGFGTQALWSRDAYVSVNWKWFR